MQPALEQSPTQAPVVQPAPDSAAAPVPAPAVPLGPDDDQERAAIWPPPPEKLLEFMMGARISIIDEPGGETDDADRQTVLPPGTSAPAPARQAPQQPPVKE